MFTNAADQTNSHPSSSLAAIDHLLQAIDKETSSSENKIQDPFASLTSSLGSAYFGIFDSLTLASQKVRPSDAANDDYDLEDDFGVEDMTMSELEEDEVDAESSEFDSSGETVMKATPNSLVRHGSSARRSGVHRGHQVGAVDFTKTMVIPTKYNDGPSPAESRSSAHVSAATLKQSSPPAA
eukprot:CAMPEP_0201869842 /NCGR_PEP_ID=MMETSP0902-20130614/3204_1 /ASSEMBLY_ACC=CAM_ASM_000551 /TAXON_ID=420261 /ORGANISM="Thalassiosira antarctica, Strain CCMP982" /LENGTH=181 /DNA_ID=CAMNT_0048395397 /DNA_START=37 /DNA_END=582 /DNA_ORIENTATION=+